MAFIDRIAAALTRWQPLRTVATAAYRFALLHPSVGSRLDRRLTSLQRVHLLRDTLHVVLRDELHVFFVQIGSHDGTYGDPLHDLIVERPGWEGIFVEPVPYVFDRLRATYGDSPRYRFEKIAIAERSGRLPFYYVDRRAKTALPDLPPWWDQLGSLDRHRVQGYFEGRIAPFVVEADVECLTLQELLDRHHVAHIDVLHVDAEGFDHVVVKQLDFRRYRPRVVLYEHTNLPRHEAQLVNDVLSESGYRVLRYRSDTLAIRSNP